ncbi:hypothetical protein LCGC14_2031180 [marine sediment metagenome]|uniref:Uncharacterized protein n=1 Tax=marine sediment metagenome TaxID=412755 RepID=A0A0F9FH97_9ZZZZ
MPEDFGLLADIMELRRYARAKQRVEAAKTPEAMNELSEWERDWTFRVKKYLLDRHKEWRAQTSN